MKLLQNGGQVDYPPPSNKKEDFLEAGTEQQMISRISILWTLHESIL